MSSEVDFPVFKKDTSVYIERKSMPGVQFKTDIFKVREDGNIEVFPPISDKNIRISFKAGEDIVLYYWHNGTRYFCKTMIIEFIKSEQVYSIVIPKKMNSDMKRRWKRFNVNIPIAFLKANSKEDDIIGEDRLFSATTINLSGGGALINTHKMVSAGEYIGLAMKIGNEVCVIDGKVLKIDSSEISSSGFNVIIEFYKFGDAEKEYLESLLSKNC